MSDLQRCRDEQARAAAWLRNHGECRAEAATVLIQPTHGEAREVQVAPRCACEGVHRWISDQLAEETLLHLEFSVARADALRGNSVMGK